MKHTGSDEDGRNAMEDHKGEIIVSDNEELFVSNVLEDSRHRDGSIYTGMDIWWKQAFLGVVPHFGLWKHLYHCKPGMRDRRLQVVGGASLEHT